MQIKGILTAILFFILAATLTIFGIYIYTNKHNIFDSDSANKTNSPQSVSSPAPNNESSPEPTKASYTDKKLAALYKLLLDAEPVSGALYTSSEAIDTVTKYDKTITEYSDKLNMPKAYIQAILLKELSTQDGTDTIADNLVEVYFKQMKEKGSSSAKQDSSTGLGQIFSKTAIYAHNNLVKKGIIDDSILSSEWQVRRTVWEQLKDSPEYNIQFVAYTLKSNALNLGIKDMANVDNTKITKILTSYNGSGEMAKKYGDIVYTYYAIYAE